MRVQKPEVYKKWLLATKKVLQRRWKKKNQSIEQTLGKENTSEEIFQWVNASLSTESNRVVSHLERVDQLFQGEVRAIILISTPSPHIATYLNTDKQQKIIFLASKTHMDSNTKFLSNRATKQCCACG